MIKLFNLDLHISVIADVQYIINRLFPFDIQIHAESLSGHAVLMNKIRTNKYIINSSNWKSLDEKLIETFYQTHKEELEKYDGFIVTHTISFALLYEKFNKPIIIINSTRYEQPASHSGNLSQWKMIETGLKRIHDKGLLVSISNNIFDQKYLKEGTKINSMHIPSLCLYTNTDYLLSNQKHNAVIIYSSMKTQPIINFPNIININQMKPYSYLDLIKFRGIIHIPYEVSTMSIFEHYSMNIPLIFPSETLLRKLFKDNKINFYGSYAELFQTKIYPSHLEGVLGEDWFDKIVSYADFYDSINMPYITYFNSFEELPLILEQFDSGDIYMKMKQHNLKRRLNVFKKWSTLIMKTFNLGKINMDPLNENIDKIITTDRIMNKINLFNNPSKIKYFKTDFILKSGIWRDNLIEKYNFDSEILVNGHSDYEINNAFVMFINNNNNNNKLKKIYSINSNNTCNFTLGLPLGITNYCNDSDLHRIYGNLEMMKEISENKFEENKNLVLLNINRATHPERLYVYDLFSKESYVTTIEPISSMEGRKKYLIDITKSIFVLCPRGNGIDTHRMWETLYMGSIPIVLYSDAFASFIGLPILFINDWKEINEVFLREKIVEIKSRKWMFDKLYLDYWMKLLNLEIIP